MSDTENNQQNEENKEENVQEIIEKPQKKGRKFYGKEFRQKLLSKNAYEAIKHFVNLCVYEQTQDYALEYLESGGSCTEFIRIIETSENKNASYILPIIEAFSIVLLKIISSHPQKHLNAESSCRELLNKHFSVIKSMLALSSNTIQRKTVLKLLATMNTLSSTLAKSILTQVFFDEACLQVLTNPSSVEDGSSVRTSYIHYLISFIIEGHAETIQLLIKKPFLIQSAIPGLVYDTPEIINVFISTLKTNILENIEISKTSKMLLFNQKVVQNFINLYEWKGPKNFNSKKKQSLVVDASDRQYVCDIVHKFLLVLCTSTKFGVAFQDDSLGLAKNNHNNLLSNVIKSLRKPWNNYFIGDLVTNICISCPDLIKEILHDIEISLEVRISQNWLNAIQFLKNIISHFKISTIEKFLSKFTAKQLFLSAQNFFIPQNILNIISTAVQHEHFGIKYESNCLLFAMLNCLEKHINVIKLSKEISEENKINFKDSLNTYLIKNLPPTSIFLNWENFEIIEDSIITIPDYNKHVGLLVDILYKYKQICPDLIDEISKDLNINNFLTKINQQNIENTIDMQIKAFNFFISCDTSFFHPSKELFKYSFPLLLKTYFQSENELKEQTEIILENIFNITGIFEGCDYEIFIYLYSILQEDYSENCGEFLVKVFQNTSQNYLQYIKELNIVKDTIDNNTFNIKSWLMTKENINIKSYDIQLKHKTFSPLIVGLLNELLIAENSELNIFVNKIMLNLLFSQTNPSILSSFIIQDKYQSVFNKFVLKYCKNMQNILNLEKCKKLFDTDHYLYKIFLYIFESDTNIDIINDENIHSYIFSINFILHYYTQCLIYDKVDEIIQNKCLQYIFHIVNNSENDKIIENSLNSIFKHSVLLNYFSPTNENMCTEFIIQIIRNLLEKKSKNDLEIYLNPFRLKLVEKFAEILTNLDENCKINENLLNIVNLFEFNFEQSSEILNIISTLPHNKYYSNNNIVMKILTYILQKDFGSLKPFDDKIIKNIGDCIEKLNSENLDLNLEDFEISFANYINKYPHLISNFNKEFFEKLILKPNLQKSSIKLATTLIKYNKEFLLVFELNLNKILEKRELVFSILNVVKDFEKSKSIFELIYKEYEQIILKFINKPQKVPNYLIENFSVINNLINNNMNAKCCINIFNKIQKYDVTENYHSEVLISIFKKAILNTEDENKKITICTNFITTFMHLLVNILKREKNDDDWEKIEKIATGFSVSLINIINVYKINYNDENIYKNTFQNFSKLCLKFGLQNHPVLIKILKLIISLTQVPNDDFGILFEMAISHSESLNILLSTNNIKPHFLSLLLILCKKASSVMNKTHIPVFLGAYNATLNESDQYILQILQLYEKANIGFHEYRPYLWGSAAVDYYSIKTGGANNLWRHPSPKEVLNILKEDQIIKTINNFPIKRQLKVADCTLYSDTDLEVYDPTFYLPLFSHLLAPESTIRWYMISNRSIICLVIICLSSECEDIRKAAIHVLSRFYNHVESAINNKRRLVWQHLVEFLCRGTLTQPNLQLTSTVALFMCQCATKFTNPNDLLYKPLGQYIKAKEVPNFDVVPELLEMLFNNTVTYKTHRLFILKIIRDGIKTENDLKIIFRSMAFKLIMDLYNSSVCNYECKKIILHILSTAVSFPHASKILINLYSLLSWLHTNLLQIKDQDFELLSYFIDILNNLIANPYDKLKYHKFKILLILTSAIDILKYSQINLETTLKYVKTLYLTYERRPDVLNNNHLIDLLAFSSKFVDCNVSNYYLKFGTEFYETPILKSDKTECLLQYYLQLLTLKWIDANEK